MSELHNDPIMIKNISPYSIKQKEIGDCSFVSSLAVAALYEQTFDKKIVSNIIFPQNKKGIPIYNECGKYICKLFINGCWRKVEIDDRLPVSKYHELICSYSKISNEFWVSILEKAFLKIFGGYDFPGSTSCEDLHVLTGWIPERVFLQKDKNLDFNRLFDRIVSGKKYGDCLVTVGTTQMTKEQEDQTGLVEQHAYAVLRVEKLGYIRYIYII